MIAVGKPSSQFVERFPLAFVLLLSLGLFVISRLASHLSGGTALRAADLDRLLVVTVAGLYAVIVTALFGWWREVGFNGIRRWRNLRLMLVPLLLVLLPVALGVPLEFGSTLARPAVIVAVAYASFVVAFNGELLYRGLSLHALRQQGPAWAALIASLFFGLGYLGDLFDGQDVGFTLVQAGYAVFAGLGYAAIRIKTGSLWPSIVVNFAHSFFWAVAFSVNQNQFHAMALEVVFGPVMGIFGVIVLREYGFSRARPLARDKASNKTEG
jgi:uncharacterized protein